MKTSTKNKNTKARASKKASVKSKSVTPAIPVVSNVSKVVSDETVRKVAEMTVNKRRYTRFTDELRKEIADRLASGEHYKKVADTLKVSLPNIYKVKRSLSLVRSYVHKQSSEKVEAPVAPSDAQVVTPISESVPVKSGLGADTVS